MNQYTIAWLDLNCVEDTSRLNIQGHFNWLARSLRLNGFRQETDRTSPGLKMDYFTRKSDGRHITLTTQRGALEQVQIEASFGPEEPLTGFCLSFLYAGEQVTEYIARQDELGRTTVTLNRESWNQVRNEARCPYQILINEPDTYGSLAGIYPCLNNSIFRRMLNG